MRNTTFNGTLVNQSKLRKAESKDWTGYQTSIMLAAGGGLFFTLLGAFLLVIYGVSDRNSAVLNYVGVSSLVIAFIFFGVSAHFMDKSEGNECLEKRNVFKKSNRN